MRLPSCRRRWPACPCLGAALLPAARPARRPPTARLQKKQMAEVVDTEKFKKAGPVHDRRRRRLHEQLLGRVLPAAHPLRSLAAQGREGRDRHRRGLQPGQAGRRHRGPDRQERRASSSTGRSTRRRSSRRSRRPRPRASRRSMPAAASAYSAGTVRTPSSTSGRSARRARSTS